MRLTHILAATVALGVLAGCTANETIDTVDVDLKKVTSKVNYQLSGKIVQKMQAMSMAQTSPIMLRIFKEEGILEVWKANTSNRFEKLREYKICAWSGKLGPKVKEGDRQAPEGFYPLAPGQMNPNSSYYLAINTGFPNQFDRANSRYGTNLMIHGACSSSGCYSMTDEQMQEIFALARDAYKGGQKTIQLQALPFRMTAENMARHKDNPNISFWNQLKAGYDQFEITKRPPEVNICEKKYVFNQQTDGKFNPAGQCPAMSTPPAMASALSTYNKKYDADYAAAMKKYNGMAWYEPSEAERKAVVAETRKGKELAYAPTGTSLEAGKLMKVADLQKQELARQEREDARKAMEIQKAELEKTTRNGKNVPVPEENPLPRPAEQIAVASAPEKKSFWGGLFKNNAEASAPVAMAQPAPEALPPAGQEATASLQKSARSTEPAKAAGAAQQPVVEQAAVSQAPVDGTPIAPAPAKKGFWSFLKPSSTPQQQPVQMPAAVAETPALPATTAEPAKAQPKAVATTKAPTVKPAEAPASAATPAPLPVEQPAVVAQQLPQKRPFWKLWGN